MMGIQAVTKRIMTLIITLRYYCDAKVSASTAILASYLTKTRRTYVFFLVYTYNIHILSNPLFLYSFAITTVHRSSQASAYSTQNICVHHSCTCNISLSKANNQIRDYCIINAYLPCITSEIWRFIASNIFQVGASDYSEGAFAYL